MLFLLRARAQCESAEQALADGLMPAYRVLSSFGHGAYASVADLSSDDAATRRSALLDVSRVCLEQPLCGNEQASAIMVTFACISFVSPSEWLQPADAAPIIGALLYCSRLFSLLVHLDERKLWDPATLTFTSLHDDLSARAHAWEAFEDRQDDTLSRKSDTIVPHLAMIGDWKEPDADQGDAEVPNKRHKAA